MGLVLSLVMSESVRLFAPKVKHMFVYLLEIPETVAGLGFGGRLYYEHPFAMVEAEGRTPVRPHHKNLTPTTQPPTTKETPMATIVFAGQLQPTTRRTAIRQAAHTRQLQRVYRRRRLGAMFAITAVAAAVLLSMFSLFGASAAADGSAGRSAAPKYVVAQPGDTLWSIGERIAPNAPISEVVDHLVRLNGTAITSGQLIRIP